MTTSQKAQKISVHLFLGLAALQFFLAGLGVFRANPRPADKITDSSTFDAHRIGGDVISLVTLVILVLAIVTRRELRLCVALFVAMVIQNILAGLGDDTPFFGALHALNGVLLLGLGAILLTRFRPAAAPAPAVR
jgi:hypothetical protein